MKTFDDIDNAWNQTRLAAFNRITDLDLFRCIKALGEGTFGDIELSRMSGDWTVRYQGRTVMRCYDSYDINGECWKCKGVIEAQNIYEFHDGSWADELSQLGTVAAVKEATESMHKRFSKDAPR